MQETETVIYDIDYMPTEPDIREDDCYLFWDMNKMIANGIVSGVIKEEIAEPKYIKPIQYNLFS